MKWHAKLALLAVTAMAVLIGIGVLATRTPTLAPVASIKLVGYTNFTMSDPDTNVFVYPGRGSWLRATMLLTNEGLGVLAYVISKWHFVMHEYGLGNRISHRTAPALRGDQAHSLVE